MRLYLTVPGAVAVDVVLMVMTIMMMISECAIRSRASD